MTALLWIGSAGGCLSLRISRTDLPLISVSNMCTPLAVSSDSILKLLPTLPSCTSFANRRASSWALWRDLLL